MLLLARPRSKSLNDSAQLEEKRTLTFDKKLPLMLGRFLGRKCLNPYLHVL